MNTINLMAEVIRRTAEDRWPDSPFPEMTERRVLDAVQQHFAIAGPPVAMLVAALLGREAKAMPSCLFEVGQKRYSSDHDGAPVTSRSLASRA